MYFELQQLFESRVKKTESLTLKCTSNYLYQIDIKDAEDPIDPNVDGDEDEEDLLDSDDDDELSDRMAGVDLDDADAIWKLLTPGERKEFERLVDTGDISKMVPEYKPWWEFRCLIILSQHNSFTNFFFCQN